MPRRIIGRFFAKSLTSHALYLASSFGEQEKADAEVRSGA